MLKLMKLEFKKNKMTVYIRSVLIINLILLAQLLFIAYVPQSDKSANIHTASNMFLLSNSLVKAVFIIFAAVLISNLVVNEYKKNTISVLFTYPINRKKLMTSKLLVIVIFTFTSIVLSNIFIDSMLSIFNNLKPFLDDRFTKSIIISNFINIISSSAACAGISLIPLFIAIIKKSTSLTIVTAIVLVSILCSDTNGFSLGSLVLLNFILCAIGVLIAYLSIINIEHKDI